MCRPPPRRISQNPASKREPGAARSKEGGSALGALGLGQQQGQVDGDGEVGIIAVGGHADMVTHVRK